MVRGRDIAPRQPRIVQVGPDVGDHVAAQVLMRVAGREVAVIGQRPGQQARASFADLRRGDRIRGRDLADRGYDEASFVESFVILNGVGGDCVDDFDQLRQDQVLAETIGDALRSSAAVGQFLSQFHSEEKIEETKQQLGLGKVAYIAGENAALQGLGQVNRDLVSELGRRYKPDQPLLRSETI